MRIAKKLLAMTVVLAMVMGLTSATLFASNDVRVVVNGFEVEFVDQGPIMVGNHVFAPVRGVFTQMGFTPTWNSTDRVATLTSDDVTVVIPADGAHFYVNGEIVTPSIPQMMLNGRIMLPVGAIATAVGAETGWDPAERVAFIISVVGNVEPVDEDVVEEDEDVVEEDEDVVEEDIDEDAVEEDEVIDEADEDVDEEDEDIDEEDEDEDNDDDSDEEDNDDDNDDEDDENDEEDEESDNEDE